MKQIGALTFLILTFLVVSCSNPDKEHIQATATDFMEALKNQDVQKMHELYPDITNIDIFYASDTSFLQTIELISKDVAQVNYVSQYLNEAGGMETRKVILFLKSDKDQPNGYVIADSYGLCSWESYPHFPFAIHTGCIETDSDLTDQQAIAQLKIAKDLLFYYAKLLYQDLETNIRITSSTILEQDTQKASGRAVVANSSAYTLPDLRYVIVYYDEMNREIGNEGGWVTQEAFPSGQEISFDFVTNFDPDAATASFKLDFDLELILQFVMEDDVYSGNEYKDFVSKQMTDV